jgi:two-component system NtrC family sensor kinase
MIKLANGTGSLREPDAALLRALLDSIPGRVSIIDTEDRYLYANKELLDFVGKPPSEVIGHKLVEIQGESALRVFAPLRDRVLTGVTTKFEGWITYFGDQRRYVKQVLTPYKSGDGKVEGFFFIGRDQTEIKEREIELAQQTEALRVSEATMAAVVLSALDGIIVIDEAARILEFNPAAEAMFGYSRSFAVGRLMPISSFQAICAPATSWVSNAT